MADTAEPHETPGDVTPEDRLAAAALAYAERGYHVLPVEPNAKGPLTRHGYKDASTDTDQIKAWWTRWPDANIGLALSLSGLVAVDIDAYKDDCEWPTFAVGRDVPATLEQRSARGGTHLIFRAEPGARYRDKPCKGVDGKHQGYILAEPSAFEGGVYRFQNDMTPAQAPEWLKRPERTAAETFGNPNGTSGRSMAEVEEALSHISADVSYDDWYPVLMAIHHEFGDEGVSIADEWSARAPHRYKEGLVYEKFAGFGKSEVSQHAPVTAATLFKLAKEAGADLAALSHKHQAKRVIGLFEVIENPNAIPFPAKYDPDDTALATVFDQIAKRDRAPTSRMAKTSIRSSGSATLLPGRARFSWSKNSCLKKASGYCSGRPGRKSHSWLSTWLCRSSTNSRNGMAEGSNRQVTAASSISPVKGRPG